jgi:PQQ system protein
MAVDDDDPPGSPSGPSDPIWTEVLDRIDDDPVVQGLLRQNATTLGRALLFRAELGFADEGPDGVMRATLRILRDQLVWQPSILVMPHGGDLELDLYNDDQNTHAALLPSNGHSQFIWLVNHSHGTARINLDGPGIYWFSSPIGNDAGRGLTGAIVVGGDVPEEARLDRPSQPRP